MDTKQSSPIADHITDLEHNRTFINYFNDTTGHYEAIRYKNVDEYYYLSIHAVDNYIIDIIGNNEPHILGKGKEVSLINDEKLLKNFLSIGKRLCMSNRFRIS